MTEDQITIIILLIAFLYQYFATMFAKEGRDLGKEIESGLDKAIKRFKSKFRTFLRLNPENE